MDEFYGYYGKNKVHIDKFLNLQNPVTYSVENKFVYTMFWDTYFYKTSEPSPEKEVNLQSEDVKKIYYRIDQNMNERGLAYKKSEDEVKIKQFYSSKNAVNPSLAYRDKPNRMVLTDPFRDAGVKFHVQDFRHFAGLTSNPSQQVEKVLLYFLENWYWLQDPDYIQYMQLLLFEPGLLLDRLSGRPEEIAPFVALIERFVTSTYKRFNENKEFEASASLLQVSRRLKKYLHFAAKKNPEKWQTIPIPPMLDVKKEASFIIHSAGSEKAKAIAAGEWRLAI
jgi:hypothetical protein